MRETRKYKPSFSAQQKIAEYDRREAKVLQRRQRSEIERLMGVIAELEAKLLNEKEISAKTIEDILNGKRTSSEAPAGQDSAG